MKPKKDEIPTFYQGYVDTLPEGSLVELLEHTSQRLKGLFENVSDSHSDNRYEEGKWTISEVLQHIIDSERVFVYRALRFSRNDQIDLPGFDQNMYVEESMTSGKQISALLEELVRVRETTIDFFKNLSPSQLARSGTANGLPMSVNVIGFITAGHLNHHVNILEERYLPLLS